MIIQCPECQTRFRLPDEKMKPGGTKVRCSRCKHIFTAAAPDAPSGPVAVPEEEKVDFGAFNMQSVEEEDQRGLGETAGPAEFSASAVPSSLAFSTAEQPGESDEAAGTEADQTEPTVAPGGLADASGRDIHLASAPSSTFDGGDSPEVDEPSGPVFGPEEESAAGIGEFVFAGNGEVEPGGGDFSFEDPEEPALGAGEFSFSNEESGAGSEFSFDGPLSEDDPFAGNENQEFAFSSEPDSAEEFDFSHMSFGEDQPEPETTPIPELASVPRKQDLAPSVDLPRETASPSFSDQEPILRPPSARPRKSPLGRVLGVVFLLLLILAGAAGYFFWQGGIPDLSQWVAKLTGVTQPASSAGQIRLTELSGFFIQNREVGQLFIIRGKAVNEFRESRSSIAVKGILYDDKGQPLLQQTVFSGNMLDEEALRTLPFAKIEESMNNQFGDSLSNLNVSPGKSIPFVIIFKNLPPNLAEFTVEVGDSKPGSS